MLEKNLINPNTLSNYANDLNLSFIQRNPILAKNKIALINLNVRQTSLKSKLIIQNKRT